MMKMMMTMKNTQIVMLMMIVLGITRNTSGCKVYIENGEDHTAKFYAYDGADGVEWVVSDTLTLDGLGDSGHVKCSADGKDRCEIRIEYQGTWFTDIHGDCGDTYYFALESSTDVSWEKISGRRRRLRA